MGDNWDDSDDDWDNSSVDDVELDKRLGLVNVNDESGGNFDDEQDLAITEKKEREKAETLKLKTKGNALAAKKAAEKERKEEEELVRKAMEIESKMEENMTADERRLLQKRRVEEADNALTDDLFGGVDNIKSQTVGSGGGMKAGDTVIMKDLKDHLKHARKVGQCVKVSDLILFFHSFMNA